MSVEAVVFGEALWDIFPDAERLGGAPLNFAVRLAELGHSTALLTRLGADARGDAALEILRGTGVNLSLVQRDDVKQTGTVVVTLSPGGSPEYEIVRDAAYDRIEATPAALDAVGVARCLYYGTLSQRTEASRASLRTLIGSLPEGAMHFCDINLRRDCYDVATVSQSIADATTLKLNEDEVVEVARMTGTPVGLKEFAEALLSRWESLRRVIVTLGERGALAAGPEGLAYSPGRTTTVVDLVGAGDAFAAAFVHGTFRDWPIARRLAFANAVGAMVAGQPGATMPLDLARLDGIVGGDTEMIIDERFRDLL